jgi:hypothetical protein
MKHLEIGSRAALHVFMTSLKKLHFHVQLFFEVEFLALSCLGTYAMMNLLEL